MSARIFSNNVPLGPQQEKNSEKKDEQSSSPSISTIPELFYGGADPDIYKPIEQKEPLPQSASRVVQAPNPKPVVPPLSSKMKTTPSVSSPQHASPLPLAPAQRKKRPWVIILIVVLFFLIFFGFSGYYILHFLRARNATTPPRDSNNPQVSTTTLQTDTLVTIPTTTLVDSAVTTSSDVAPDITSLPSQLEQITFPRIVLTSLPDIDIDDLTDEEEVFFSTDSGIWDSDGDGYFDGQEVVNLYSPKEIAPSRLIDSGIIREYTNAPFRYRVYYPSQWVSGSVTPDGTQELFSSPSGDYVSIFTFQKAVEESFAEWFGRIIPQGQLFTDLQQFTNRFSQIGWMRKDHLVAYYPTDTVVFVFVYYPSSTNIPRYPHIMDMMVQSFRPNGSGTFLPEQQVIIPEVSTSTEPAVPASTSTPVF